MVGHGWRWCCLMRRLLLCASAALALFALGAAFGSWSSRPTFVVSQDDNECMLWRWDWETDSAPFCNACFEQAMREE